MKKFIIITGNLFFGLSMYSAAIDNFASGLENIANSTKSIKKIQSIINTPELIKRFSKIDTDFTDILKKSKPFQEFLLKNKNLLDMLIESQIIRDFFDEDNHTEIINKLMNQKNSKELESLINKYNTFKKFPQQLNNFNQSWPFSDEDDMDDE